MDVRELDIDLIDRINPFGEAYAILAKTMSEESLKQVAAVIAAKRSSLTLEEARELAKRALKFKKERGRLPSITSPDAWEKRMAEGRGLRRACKAEAALWLSSPTRTTPFSTSLASRPRTRKRGRRTPREERIIAGFEEIQRFVEKHGRAPQHGEDRDIFERLYAVRLDRLRELEECRALLEPLDHQGLLAGADAQPLTRR